VIASDVYSVTSFHLVLSPILPDGSFVHCLCTRYLRGVRMAREEKPAFDLGLGLERTHVMITGAAGQIGQVITEAFLAAGASVTAVDTKESRSRRKDKFMPLQADIADEQEVAAAFEKARVVFGGIDCLVHTAGKDLSFLGQSCRDDCHRTYLTTT
jgi:NADPH:quinone reductase-like Zn-dependent oxidoreductase